MTQIPGEFVQSVLPKGDLNYQTEQATPQEFGAQMGKTLEAAGNMLGQHAVERQQLVNETNVNDVYANQFSPQLRGLQNEFMKLEGKDAEAQFPAYEQKMTELRQQVMTALPNDPQRNLFDKAATRRTQSELDSMSRHAASQAKAWEWHTHNAVIADLAGEAEANYNNPQRLQNVLDRLDNETIDYGSKHGWSSEVFKYQRGENQDKLWSAVIRRQALADPVGAQKTYQEQVAAGRISGSAQGKLEQFLQPIQERLSADAAVGRVSGGATAQAIGAEAQRQGIDPSTMLTVWSAEGGVTNPATKNPKSSATGIFQHIDSTWAEQGGTPQDRLDANRQIELGVALTKKNSAALAKDLGRQPQAWEIYLAHQQGIAGATALLHADPNANAAAVLGGSADKLTLNGMRANATVGEALGFIKGYVQRHARMYDASGGPSASNLADNYEQHLFDLADQARRDYPGDPSAVERYQAHYMQQAGRTIQAQEKTENANWKVVNNALTGPQAFQSKEEFLADPGARAAYDAIYERDHSIADKIDDIFTKKNLGEWNPAPTPESDNTYGSLRGYSREDPDRFAAMDLHPYYGAIPESQYNDLVSRQQKILDRDKTETAKTVKISSVVGNAQDIIARAQNRLYRDQTPYPNLQKTGGSQAQLKYFKFVSALEQDLDDFEKNNGRAPKYDEQRQIVTQRLFPNGIKEPEAKPQPGKPGAPAQASGSGAQPEISPEASAKYEAALKTSNYPVTPANIKALYDQENKQVAKK
jgi:hypothetical protein